MAYAFEGLESSGMAVKYCFLHLFSDWITPLCSLSLTLIKKKKKKVVFHLLVLWTLLIALLFYICFTPPAHIPCAGGCLFLYLIKSVLLIKYIYIYEVAYDFH